MNTNVLAAGVIGFLLGGLTVSTAAQLEEDQPQPGHHSSVATDRQSSQEPSGR